MSHGQVLDQIETQTVELQAATPAHFPETPVVLLVELADVEVEVGLDVEVGGEVEFMLLRILSHSLFG